MNWPIFFIWAVALFAQNAYFGWNAFPHSDNEMLADLLCLVILTLAFTGKKP